MRIKLADVMVDVFNFKKFHLIHSVLKYWLSKLCLIETPIIRTIIYSGQLLDHRIIHVSNLNYDYILGHNIEFKISKFNISCEFDASVRFERKEEMVQKLEN